MEFNKFYRIFYICEVAVTMWSVATITASRGRIADRLAVDLYTIRQKKEPIFSCVHLSYNSWQKLVNSFVFIKERINYNSMYLILACVKNFA